jgi:hypothetical protein
LATVACVPVSNSLSADATDTGNLGPAPARLTLANLRHRLAKVRVSETAQARKFQRNRCDMMKIELLDGNVFDIYDSLAEATKAASGWYDYLAEDDGPLSERDLPDLNAEGITDVNGLNQAISDWEEQLAKEMGFRSFTGRGASYVQAADEAGLRMVAREVAGLCLVAREADFIWT